MSWRSRTAVNWRSGARPRAIAHRHVDRAKQRPRRRINRQNSMQQQSTYSPAAPHRSKSASPCRLAPERQFTAVLDRQDIATPSRRRSRPRCTENARTGLAGPDGLPPADGCTILAARPAQLAAEPPFLQATIAKLSQPNCIANPCHRRPPANQQASRNQPSSLEAIEMCAYDSRCRGARARAAPTSLLRKSLVRERRSLATRYLHAAQSAPLIEENMHAGSQTARH